jgi:hypothetical protein
MRLHDQWDILAALPYLAAGFGLAWVGLTLALRQAARFRSQRKQKREDAARRASGPTPWNDWLREINAQSQQDRLDTVQGRARGKWRE